MANRVLLKQGGYASLTKIDTELLVDKEYRLLTNQLNKVNKDIMRALAAFIINFNTFISIKFPDEKNNYLIITDKQTTSDTSINKTLIKDVETMLTAMENKLNELENYMGFSKAQYLYLNHPEIHVWDNSGYNMYVNRHGMNIRGFVEDLQIKTLVESETQKGIADYKYSVTVSTTFVKKKA